MDITQSLDWLSQLRQTGGICPGTQRIRQALALWDDPQNRLRVVHVAGTNGKGSVCAMLREIGTAAGYRTGLFSSPAPLSVCDTITVDGVSITPPEFAALCTEIRAICEKARVPLSEFEVNTLLAILYFERRHCDLTVMECGMGGAEDATNVFSAPLACVLTAVSLDHTAFLGDTVAAITRSKCGILKPGCTVVTLPDQNEEALEALFACAAEQGATVCIPGGTPAVKKASLQGSAFSLNGKDYEISLPGRFQVSNAQAVLEVVRVLNGKGFSFTDKVVQGGLKRARISCRQELVSAVPVRLIDGAHNPQGIAALADTLRTHLSGQRLTGLFGMLRDKDCRACVAVLAPLFERVVCCTPQNSRAMPAEELAALFWEQGVSAFSVDPPEEALCKAESLAGEDPLIIGGSFYTALPIRAFFN